MQRGSPPFGQNSNIPQSEHYSSTSESFVVPNKRIVSLYNADSVNDPGTLDNVSSPSASVLILTLLGRPEVTLNGAPLSSRLPAKSLALLLYLAVEKQAKYRRESLVDRLWPDASPTSGRQSLRQTLYTLARVLSNTLRIDRTSVGLDPATDLWLDVTAFSALMAACHAHSHRQLDGCPDCILRLEEAVALYRGDFLAGFSLPDSETFSLWQMAKLEDWRGQALAALTAVAAFRARRQEYGQAIGHLRRALELAPWQEESHRQLMRALALDDQHSAALTQYEICMRILAESLDVTPAPETSALRQRIEAGLLQPEVMEAGNPYRGLFAFAEQDAADFYGRDAMVQRLRDTVEVQPLVAVLGASGSGKSSLLYAGLLPSLRRSSPLATLTVPPNRGGAKASWIIVDFQPGPDPFAALAEALSPCSRHRRIPHIWRQSWPGTGTPWLLWPRT